MRIKEIEARLAANIWRSLRAARPPSFLPAGVYFCLARFIYFCLARKKSATVPAPEWAPITGPM